MTLGNFTKALRYFKSAIRINPNSEDAYYYLGLYYFKKDDYLKAIRYYEKSLLINDMQTEVYLNLGMCYLRLNLYDKALEEFEMTNKYDKNCIDAVYNKSIIFMIMKNYHEALKNLAIIYNREPDNVQILMDIAHCYYKIGDSGKSKDWVQKLLLKDPDHELANKLNKRLINIST